jgi:hypothetical protein
VSVSTSENHLSDEVTTELNPPEQPEPAPAEGPQRPASNASRQGWLDYLVHLGADRAFIEGETEHFDADQNRYVQAPKLSRDELIALADRLGG